jgi:hypothetical protein
VEIADAARRWAETWKRGWETHDVEAIVALYAEGARFRSAPFRGLQAVREYVEWAFANERRAECRFGKPFVAGDRVTCEYWAVVEGAEGESTIAGVALIRFREDGLVAEQRDYWHEEPGRRGPPPGFGR